MQHDQFLVPFTSTPNSTTTKTTMAPQGLAQLARFMQYLCTPGSHQQSHLKVKDLDEFGFFAFIDILDLIKDDRKHKTSLFTQINELASLVFKCTHD